MDPADFNLPNQPAVQQASSFFVDCLPEPGSAYVPASSLFSNVYAELVGGAEPAPGLPADEQVGARETVAAAKRTAANAEVVAISGAGTYLPTTQEPKTWWDPTGPQWANLSISERTGNPVIPVISPPPWRWLSLKAATSSPAPGVPAQKVVVDSLASVRVPASALMRSSAFRLSTGSLINMFRISIPVSPTSTGYSVTLDYCYVNLLRPWMDPMWWQRTDWIIPGYPAGSFAAGDPTVAGQLVPAIPVGLICVKNVVIEASWSARDGTLGTAALALGPFYLAGARFDSVAGRLIIPGLQVIAWICQIPPKLPPQVGTGGIPSSDWTTEVVMALAPLAQGANGDTVRTLQGLLMARGALPNQPDSLDGDFGPNTAAAVKQAQTDLKVTGDAPASVGSNTWTALITGLPIP